MEELQAIYDSRLSFYGKAHTRKEGDKLILTSYTTDVAEIDKKNNVAKIHGFYSQTTLRHIKEFLLQNGFKVENKKQMEKDYMEV